MTGLRALKHMYQSQLQPLHPQSKRRITWDILSSILTLYESILIPFYIGFDYDPTYQLSVFEFGKDLFFFFEIILNFNTGYTLDGALITNRKKIALKYFRTWFAIDLIANVPYVDILTISVEGIDALMNNSYNGSIYNFSRLLKLLRIIKWVKIKKYISRIQNKIQSQVANGILSLLTLLIYIGFIAHWIACVWHYVGLNSLENGSESWLVEFGFADKRVNERYVACLFWAITTMLTVGYGDITPVTMEERIVNIFCMVIGCAMFAYSMNSIGILLQNINQEVSKKRYK